MLYYLAQGGPGIVISRGLLRLLGPKLGECLHSLLTEHEDIELGRCVAKVADVKCTMAWETRDLFYQNYDDGINSRNIRSISNKALGKCCFEKKADAVYIGNAMKILECVTADIHLNPRENRKYSRTFQLTSDRR